MADGPPRVLFNDLDLYDVVHLVEIYEETGEDGGREVYALCRDWVIGAGEGASREEALEDLCRVVLPGSITGRTIRGNPYPDGPCLLSAGKALLMFV